jgi:hypothetical protein
MNQRIRRILIVSLVLLAALLILPYLLPVPEGGIAPAELVTDPDGTFLTLQDVMSITRTRAARMRPFCC